MKKIFILSLLLFVGNITISSAKADISKYELLGTYPTEKSISDVRVKDNIAYLPVYVNETTSKLNILDISRPDNITLLGSVSFAVPPSRWGNTPVNIILDRNYAYISLWAGGLVVIDISDNESPQVVSSYSAGCGGWGTAMSGLLIDSDIMYVGWDANYGLGVFDVSDPYNPAKTTNRGGISFARFVAKKNNYVFVSTYYGGHVRIFDVSNPAAPILVSSIPTHGSAYYVGDVAGNYYYLPDSRHPYGLKIYNVADPANPMFVSQLNTQSLGLGWINDLKVYGNEAIATFMHPDRSIDSGFVASFDVTNPELPKVDSILNITRRCYLFEYANDRLYLPGSDGLYIWGIPHIEATIDINPDTINLKSRGKWVTCYIELPEGYNVWNIDSSTVRIVEVEGEGIEPVYAENRPTGIGDYDNDGIEDLMVKFDRQALKEVLPAGDYIDIVLMGELNSQEKLRGIDEVKVIH